MVEDVEIANVSSRADAMWHRMERFLSGG
jgi:hypothetical protein